MLTLFRNENALKRGKKNQEMWHHFYIEDNIGVSIIDSIPHCHTENALKTGKLVNYASFLYRRKKIVVSIIDSIPHCHTENALKKGQKQEMCLRFYIVKKENIFHR